MEDAKNELPNLITYSCNLSKAEERIELYNTIKADHPDLNILINNAGIQNWMKITDENFFERSQDEIKINIEAPIHLSSLFMKLDSLEAIINVTSGLSFSPLTKVPVYCATKAFLHSFTISLRHLLKEKNIEVIEMIPPALNTDLGGKGLHDFAPPVTDFINSIFDQLKKGETTLTFGMSEAASNASPSDLKTMFDRMNATFA